MTITDLTQDPMASLTEQQNLSSYCWQLPPDSKEMTAQRVLCHGMIQGIKWPLDDAAPISIQDKIHLQDMQVAIGSSALDALNTLITSQDNNSIPKELLDAFNHGLLHKMEESDAAVQLTEQMHQAEFGRYPAGEIWTVVATKEQDSDRAASLLDLSPIPVPALGGITQAEALDRLNQQQLNLTTQNQLLEKAQWDLYHVWWKLNRAQKDVIELKDQDNLKKLLDSTIPEALTSKIKVQQKNIESLKAEFKKSKDLLLTDLKSSDKTLKAIKRPSFWQPQDPVVLVKGIKPPPWSLIATKQLVCRYPTHYITALKKGEKTITTENIKPPLPTIKNIEAIPVSLKALIAEFFLLDPTNADRFAPAMDCSVDELRKLMTDHDQKNYTGLLPHYGLKPWSQSWFPLLVEWEITWYPLPFSQWQFTEDGYHLTSVSASTSKPRTPHEMKTLRKPTPQTLSGRNFLVPQAQFSFKGQLKRLIDQDPTFEENFPEWKELEHKLDSLDVTAFTLGGLHHRLLQLDHEMNRYPHKEYKDEELIFELIEKQGQSTPIPGPSSLFQSVRHSQFYFSRLSIIDRFGQMINVIQSNPIFEVPIYISNHLKPNTNPNLSDKSKPLTVNSILPANCIQFTPRIVQPTRLDCDWLLADNKIDSTHRLLTACQAHPVAGWLLPNYIDQSLQAFDPHGNLLGELCLREDDTETTHCIWEKAPFQPYGDLSELYKDYPWLSSMLQNLQDQPTIAGYNALREIIEIAFTTQQRTLTQYSRYLGAMAGRPLALARARWQLELAQPAHTDQNWDNFSSQQYQYQFDMPSSFTAFNQSYKFPIQLGSNNPLKQDGLVGHFLGNDFSKLYSLFTPTISSDGFVQPTLSVGSYSTTTSFTLIPTNPGIDQPQITTLLFDPFAKVHAYVDILPTHSLQLPAIFVESALAQMSITFRLGPLLTVSKTLSDTAPDSLETVRLPQLSVKGSWFWLEPQKNGLQKKELRPTDTLAHLGDQPNEMIEGLLMFNHPFTEKKSTVSKEPHPRRLLTTANFWENKKKLGTRDPLVGDIKTPRKNEPSTTDSTLQPSEITSTTTTTKTSQPIIEDKKKPAITHPSQPLKIKKPQEIKKEGNKLKEEKKPETGYFYSKNQLLPFSIIRIPGDGNCLFTATATAIAALSTSDRQSIAKKLSRCLGKEIKEITQQTLRNAVAAAVKIKTAKNKENPEELHATLDLLEQKSRLLRPMIQAISQESELTKRQELEILLMQTLDAMQERGINLSEKKEAGQYPSEQTEILAQVQALIKTLKNISKPEQERLQLIIKKIQNPQPQKKMTATEKAEIVPLYPQLIVIPGVWGDHFEMVRMNKICGIHLDPHQNLNISRETRHKKLSDLLAQEKKNGKKDIHQKIKKELENALLAAYRGQLPGSTSLVIRTSLEGVVSGADTLQQAQLKIDKYLNEKGEEAVQLYLNWFAVSMVFESQLEDDIFYLCCEEKSEFKDQGLSRPILEKMCQHHISPQTLYLPMGSTGLTRAEELKKARSQGKIIIETLFISQSHYDVPGERGKPILLQDLSPTVASPIEKQLPDLAGPQIIRKDQTLPLSQSGQILLPKVKENKSLALEKLPPVPNDIEKMVGKNAFADHKYREHFYPILDKLSSFLKTITAVIPAVKPNPLLSPGMWPLCKTNYPEYFAAYIAITDIDELKSLINKINEIITPNCGLIAKRIGKQLILYFHKNCQLANIIEQLQASFSAIPRYK